METQFTVRFLHGGYHLTVLADGEEGRTIDSLLSNFFAKGQLIDVTVKAKATGERRGLCEFKQKYGVCGDVLTADGLCRQPEHNTHSSIEEVEDAEARA